MRLPFPEDRFPAADTAAYDDRVTRGRQMMAGLSLGICLLARNCAGPLPGALRAIEAIGSMFSRWQAFAYQNDSTDRTPQLLDEWADSQPLAHVCHEQLERKKWGMVRSGQRGSHMADYRNRCRAMLLESLPTADVVIVLDSDLAGYSLEGIAHSMGTWGEWDCSASNGLRRDNGRWVQADAWAWRDETWQPLQFHQVKNQTPARGAPPVHLRSAFGGMAIYRGDAYRAVEYGGGDCEHVVMHRRMAGAGYDRLRMNPSQIVVYRF